MHTHNLLVANGVGQWQQATGLIHTGWPPTCMNGPCVRLQLSVVPVTAILNARPVSSKKSTMAVKLCGLLLQKDTSTGSLSLAKPIKLPSGKERLSGKRVVSGGSRTDTSRLS